MKRSKPLARKAPIRRRPPRRLKGPGSDPAYLESVRSLPCVARQLGAYWGPTHAHHALGIAHKRDDSTAVPICMTHYSHWRDHNGVFTLWSRDKRQEFALLAIGLTRATLAGRTTGATRGPHAD
jgi:hypothetical protein